MFRSHFPENTIEVKFLKIFFEKWEQNVFIFINFFIFCLFHHVSFFLSWLSTVEICSQQQRQE